MKDKALLELACCMQAEYANLEEFAISHVEGHFIALPETSDGAVINVGSKVEITTRPDLGVLEVRRMAFSKDGWEFELSDGVKVIDCVKPELLHDVITSVEDVFLSIARDKGYIDARKEG